MMGFLHNIKPPRVPLPPSGSVKGNEAGGFIRSRLYVADATPFDSGFYSCWYKNITSDTVTVHVIAGSSIIRLKAYL